MVNWKNFTEFYINITTKGYNMNTDEYLNKVMSEAVEKEFHLI